MPTRRAQLTREAAKLFAERGFHGTSMGDLADALGVQKGSLYSLTGSKQELLLEAMRAGARAFHAALDEVPERAPAAERVRLALRGHLRVVSEQLDVATVFTREWRYLEDGYRDEILVERRRYEERWRALFEDGVASGGLRTDLDAGCRHAARPVGGELGVHVARARPQHRRARGPLHRDRRRRHPRVRHAFLGR